MKAFTITTARGHRVGFYRSVLRNWACMVSIDGGIGVHLTDDDLRTVRDAITEHLGDERTGVVIDPEQDVERVARAIFESAPLVQNPEFWARIKNKDGWRNQARRFIACLTPQPAPTPVKEPTGLGAVVVDDGGCAWGRGLECQDTPWQRIDASGFRWRSWADLAVSTPDQIKFRGVES